MTADFLVDRMIETLESFRDKTGVAIGDVGVVVDGSKVVPVLVADGGPHSKIGEGSLALFDALGDTRCAKRLASDPRFCTKVKNYSLDRTVEYILFPGSKMNGLTPSNTNEKVRRKSHEALSRVGPMTHYLQTVS